jgi:ABC-type transport system substrate-binding protein
MKIKYNYLMWVLIFLISPVVLSSANNVIFWGSTSSPETLDPAQAWDDTSVLFTFNIYETLIKLNPETFEIEPLLAVSWKAKNQGKMWIFKLNQ